MTILGTYRVIRMKIVGDAITWSIILMTKVLIYDRNMFTILLFLYSALIKITLLKRFITFSKGLEQVDFWLTPPVKKLAFVSIWFSFCVALFLLNR